jgi:hypothetical protein
LRDRAFSSERGEHFVKAAIVPKLPIAQTRYRCGREFLLDGLHKLFQEHTPIGILIVTGEDTALYTKQHTLVSRVCKLHIDRQKHHGRGGQSAPRFQRIRLNQIDAYVALIAETVVARFPHVQDIVMAGTGEVLDQVSRHPDIVLRVRQVIRTDVLDVASIVAKMDYRWEDKEPRSAVDAAFERLDCMDPCIVYGRTLLATCAREGWLSHLWAMADQREDVLSLGLPDHVQVVYAKNHARLQAMGGMLGCTYYPMTELAE